MGEPEVCSICLEPLVFGVSSPSPHDADTENESDAKATPGAEETISRARDESSREQEEPLHHNSCGHSVHARCLHSSIRAGNYFCPVCRKSLQAKGTKDADVASAATNPSNKKYARYRRMLQNKIPKEAVKQRMTVDGLSPREIDEFFTEGASGTVAVAAGQDDDKEYNRPANRSDVTRTQMTDRYHKMMKMNMPEAAVRNKMQLDGFSGEEVGEFFRDFYAGLES